MGFMRFTPFGLLDTTNQYKYSTWQAENPAKKAVAMLSLRRLAVFAQI
jgi:hypothetical protein